MFRRRARSFALLAGLTLALATLLSNQLPANAQSDFGTVIGPERCTVEPLTEEELVDIVAAADPNSATPTWTGGNSLALADDGRNAIVATITMSIACANANDPLRAYALFTDRYLQTRFTGAGADDLGHLLAALTRPSNPAADADMLTLISMDQFLEWEDGRVSVVVVTANADLIFTDTLYLVERDGQWLIDEAIASNPAVPATPVP
ncbi:MAG: hypothetical protein IT336_12940 [Thermomicrobiales bacterium]|nr:hypothetical protein [Thermomicrobiales bacterium]